MTPTSTVLPLTFDQVATTTRAVRRRLDLTRPVPREVIAECLDIALQAPTGGNSQRWRWLVVTDAGQRTAIAGVYRGAAREMFVKARDSAVDESIRKAYAGAVDLVDRLAEVPVIVIPCALGVPGRTNAQAAGFYGSILPAVWSFQLALRSRGLGSTYITAQLRAEAEMAAILGIPDDVSQVAMIPVAYTLGTDFKPAPRQPVEAVTYLDRWDNAWG